MGDAENALPPSKKRAAGRELSRDNPGLDDEEDTSEQETGTFKKASEEVLASRRIVRVRRHQTSSAPPPPSSNPFAAIRLVPPIVSASTSEVAIEKETEKTVPEGVERKDDVSEGIEKEKDENGEEAESKLNEDVAESTRGLETTNTVNEATKQGIADEKETEGDKAENGDKIDDGSENKEEVSESASLSSFQQLSSNQNAFTGLVGTGFSSSTFSFGTMSKDGSSVDIGSGSLFGVKNDQPSYPSFGFGLSKNGSSLFATPGASIGAQSEKSGFPSMKEVPVETGEENEKAVFTADSVLFEFLDGGWKERGKGELRVNVSTTGMEKARLVMRARGNYRLILNASLYPDMKLTNMEKRGITFACMNSTGEGQDGLCTFALKFKDALVVEEFRGVVAEHKGKSVSILKTPENSPKESDD